MPFTRCTIALDSAYPLVAQFTHQESGDWVMTSLWREPHPRRADDDSLTFIREVTSHTHLSLEPFFTIHAERHNYVSKVEAELMLTLGRNSVATIEQQRTRSAELLRILPEVRLFLLGPSLQRGSSITLLYTEQEGPFWADMVVSVKFEPPMS